MVAYSHALGSDSIGRTFMVTRTILWPAVEMSEMSQRDGETDIRLGFTEFPEVTTREPNMMRTVDFDA